MKKLSIAALLLWSQAMAAPPVIWGPGPSALFLAPPSVSTGAPTNVGLTVTGTTDPNGSPSAPGSTFFATYASSINATSSSGSGTGTAFNGAAISGGVLNLNGATTKYVSYSGTSNFNQAQIWTFRALVKPNYSGSPATRQYFIERHVTVGTRAYCGVYHDPSGKIRIAYYDDGGGSIFEGDVGTWVPVSGTTYEIEWDTDLLTGANRVFINGTQLGSTNTATGTVGSTANTIYIGQGFDVGHSANFSISKLVVYPTVQHTANYTSPIVYVESQSADLQRWNSSDETTLAKVTATGAATFQYVGITPQDAGASPTCTSSQNGWLTFTSAYIMCVCNGTAWKKVSDGSTSCSF